MPNLSSNPEEVYHNSENITKTLIAVYGSDKYKNDPENIKLLENTSRKR